MIRSMTGYGRGECTLHNRKFVVEIKSVNHRYNELNIRMPKVLNALEDPFRKKLLTGIHRGKTDVFVQFESFSQDDMRLNFHESLCDAYVQTYKKMKERYALKEEINLSMLARIPDVITVESSAGNENAADEMWEALEQAAEAALTGFLSMRETEGRNLAENLAEKTRRIRELTEAVAARAPFVVSEYERKLRERIQENKELANVEIDQNRLVTEITIFADRACIDEELTRLSSHLSQLHEILDKQKEAASVGRKLDFLVQEMNREINTIGSKSNDLQITKTVVDMKSELEKVREQVQNIE